MQIRKGMFWANGFVLRHSSLFTLNFLVSLMDQNSMPGAFGHISLLKNYALGKFIKFLLK